MTNLENNYGFSDKKQKFKSGISPRRLFPGGKEENAELQMFNELYKPPNLGPNHIYVNEKVMDNVKQIYRNQINNHFDSAISKLGCGSMTPQPESPLNIN